MSWPSARLFHLGGGLRAFNGYDGTIVLQTKTLEGNVVSVSTPSYLAAYDVLHRLGKPVVGIDFLTLHPEFDNSQPPNWRSYYSQGGSATLCAEQADQWSFLAHAAFQHREPVLYDVSERIKYQLRVCDWRLRQISEAYRDQLHSRLRDKKFADGKRFLDGFTWLGYLAIQVFLIDACVLRDYLTEYFVWTRIRSGELPADTTIRQMSALKKRYLDKTDSKEQLVILLQEATAEDGWLQELGRYRDLIVHAAPLESAGKHLFAVCRQQRISQEHILPTIQLPLPLDPAGLHKARSNGEHLEDPDFAFARMGYVIGDAGQHPDGLEYAYQALCRFAWLASHMLAIAPLTAEIPDVTPHIIGEVKVIPGSGNGDDSGASGDGSKHD